MKLDLKKFCLFVGYARSGSSAVGSIVDAHPNAVISHEYNVLARNKLNASETFDAIIDKSSQLNKKGRWSGGANGEVYDHVITGQIKNKASIINVIGDKKSGSATRSLQSARHTSRVKREKRIINKISALEARTGLPCYFIHVIRNPYDIIAAQKQSRVRTTFAGFLQEVKTMDIMKVLYPDRWLDVYHEDLIQSPESEIIKINEFLGLETDSVHLEASVKHLDFKPKIRRFEIEWAPQLKMKVKGKIIRDYSFFNRYAFKV